MASYLSLVLFKGKKKGNIYVSTEAEKLTQILLRWIVKAASNKSALVATKKMVGHNKLICWPQKVNLLAKK